METMQVSNLTEYIDSIMRCPRGTLFRGMSNISYKLIPSLGRLKNEHNSEESILQKEANSFRIFKSQVHAYSDCRLFNALDLLSFAQHYGMPTRLLDWTINPLVALFFAVVPSKSNNLGNAVVYALNGKISFIDDDADFTGLFGPEKKNLLCKLIKKDFKGYVAKHWSSRIKSQDGLFTIHYDPFKEISEDYILLKISIPQDKRKEIYDSLEKHGVHEKFIFQEIGGLASWIKRTHLSL